jgi:ABC-type lipoprotein release transport system permease subunit
LFEVHSRDPRTLVAVALVLALTSAAAAAIPARRALRIDVATALRAN